MNVLTTPGLYEEQVTDEYYIIKDVTKQEPDKSINLNAITHYATLGLKPKRIAVLVGCHYTTIWANDTLRQAYENGAAYHELALRSALLGHFNKSPLAIDMALNRAAGKAEDDAQEGIAPSDRKEKDIEVKLVVEGRSNDPRLQEIEDQLQTILKSQPE